MPGFELFGDLERKELQNVMENGVLMRYGFDNMRNGHWKANELEARLEKFLGISHVQLVSSGTAALTAGLSVLGIGAGDEVIMPTFTFVASFEAILSVGAIPVLVEIDESLTIDPKLVEAAITPKTKAILPVHMCGSMADLDALQIICNKHKIILFEDACQAFGGSYKGKKLGTIGDAGVFSFDFVKTITCGEGGAFVTNKKDIAIKADQFSDHGHDHIGSDRGAEGHLFLGYNFRISELHAAIGLGQLTRVQKILEIQKNNYKIIEKTIKTIEGVQLRTIPDPEGNSFGFLSFFMPDLDTANSTMQGFKENGIDACFHYYNNGWHYLRKWDHLKKMRSLNVLSKEIKAGLSYLDEKKYPKSDALMSRNISCLMKLSWSEEEVIRRANVMKKVIENVLKN